MEAFNKNKFIDELHKAYIYKYMNLNLHCHSEMFRTLRLMSTTKMHQKDMFAAYDKMKHFILENNFQTLDALPDYPKEDKDIIKLFEKEANILVKLKDILKHEVYAILNIIYFGMIGNGSFDMIMTCINMLLSCKPKDISKDSGISVVDILINLITHIAKEKDDQKTLKHVMICRELLYFKGSVKTVKERATGSKILPMMIYVVMNNKSIDLSKPIAVCPKERYLYVVCHKDIHTKIAIEREKDLIVRKRPELKNVKAALPTPVGGKVDIVKICDYN
jgi:hypothetical protein